MSPPPGLGFFRSIIPNRISLLRQPLLRVMRTHEALPTVHCREIQKSPSSSPRTFPRFLVFRAGSKKSLGWQKCCKFAEKAPCACALYNVRSTKNGLIRNIRSRSYRKYLIVLGHLIANHFPITLRQRLSLCLCFCLSYPVCLSNQRFAFQNLVAPFFPVLLSPSRTRGGSALGNGWDRVHCFRV